jgi:hypothetical protein
MDPRPGGLADGVRRQPDAVVYGRYDPPDLGLPWPVGVVVLLERRAAAAAPGSGRREGVPVHGIIFTSLKKYATTKLGADAWTNLLREAGLAGKVYLPTGSYDDKEISALVSTASKVTGTPAQALLEDFGEFLVPDLVSIYRSMFRPEWRTLDLIESVETTIHRTVRLRDKTATPPILVVSRPGRNEVRVVHSSPRRMCGVAKGIARGVAKHYGERISLTETSCMLRNDSACRLTITTVA